MDGAAEMIEIDRSHPMARGLVFAFVPTGDGRFADLATGAVHTAKNGSLVTDIGEAGHSLEFDGGATNTRVNFGHRTDWEPDQISVTTIIRPDDNTTSDYQTVIRKGDNLTTDSWTLLQNFPNGGDISLWIYDSVFTQGATYNLTMGQVYTVTGTYDQSFIRLYVDGIERGTPVARTGAIGKSGDDLMLGARPSGIAPDRYWDGGMFLALVHNRSLSAGEVKALHENPWQLFKRNPLVGVRRRLPDTRILEVPEVWTKQPPPRTPIDWENPITEGIIRAITPTPGIFAYNAANKFIMQQSGSSFQNVKFEPTPYGLARIGDNSATQKTDDYSVDDPISNYLTKEVSMLAFFKLINQGSGITLAGEQGTFGHVMHFTKTNIPTYWRFLVSTNDSGTVSGVVESLDNDDVEPVAGGYYILIGTFSRLTGIMNLTARRVDTGGREEYQSTGQDIADDFVGIELCEWGTHEDSAVLEYVVWNRVLSKAERDLLVDNPWQIFKKDNIHVPIEYEELTFDEEREERLFMFPRQKGRDTQP